MAGQPERTHVIRIDNFASMDVGSELLEDLPGMLGRMTRDGNWVYVISRIPAGTESHDPAAVAHMDDNYLQVAGTEDQGFVVEVKCGLGESTSQFGVGRPGGPTMTGLPWRRTPRQVTIRFGGLTVTVPDNEALTVEETTRIIDTYFREDDIPAEFRKRELDMRLGRSGSAHQG